MAVLAAFNDENRRLTQADLARKLGLRATVRRAVLTFDHLGYLVADGHVYELSPQILRLAAGYVTSSITGSVVQPVCDRICAHVQEACSVAVLDSVDAARLLLRRQNVRLTHKFVWLVASPVRSPPRRAQRISRRHHRSSQDRLDAAGA